MVFIALIVWLIYQLGYIGSTGLLFGALISPLASLSGYWWGDKIILSTLKAVPATRQEQFSFFTAAENISLAARIPMPRLYVIKSSALNAFATGRDEKHAVVCATTGLLVSLEKREIEAVVAHEISHIKNYDTRLMTIVTVLVGFLAILADMFSRGAFISGRSNSDRSRGSGLFALVGFFLILFSPLIAQLIQLAISRRREFLADAGSAMLTRNPAALVSALTRLSLDKNDLRSASLATENLFIVNPFKSDRFFARITSLFSTHPPLEDRLSALRKML